MGKVNQWQHLLSLLSPLGKRNPHCVSKDSFRKASHRTIIHPGLCLFSWYTFFFKFIYLCIYSWLCWVFVSVWGLSLVAASGGHSSSRCTGLSLSRPLLLQSIGSRRKGSVVVAHGPSCSAACGIFPDQGSNPCPLRWQADSQPLHHQGSPLVYFLLMLPFTLRSVLI